MITGNEYKKPLPKILPETEEYWKAAKRHELFLQRCKNCGQVIYFPRIICFKCLSDELEWFKSKGCGTVYSYTIIRYQIAHKSFEPDVPYIYAIIDLDEGVRMISNVINIVPSKINIGMRVKVIFEDVTNEVSIPKFEPL
jgi:uncharacterized protein